MSKLLPCPFCGGEVEEDWSAVMDLRNRSQQDGYVECKSCDYYIHLVDGDPDTENLSKMLYEKWNKRHAES